MTSVVTMSTLDAVLALQLTVAWAGEGASQPPRLGWWQTDLVDAAGGGDLFARLLPRTHPWASLEAVRKAARQTDQRARLALADPDRLRTLFALGFELDERLDERLAQLKRAGRPPLDALPFPVDFEAPFQPQAVSDALRLPGVDQEYRVIPGGRQMKGPAPQAPELLAHHLGAALLPFADQYPLPFYRLVDG